jgi:hypothetical protein
MQTFYSMPVAVKAAQFPSLVEWRRQVFNGPIKLRNCDRETTGSGIPVGYSRRRILQAAIVRKLIPLGVTNRAAGRCALAFTDEGTSERAAGQLYPHGKTILCVSAQGAKVLNAMFDVTLADATDREVAAITIDLNQVVAQVDAVLNNESAK